MYLATRLVLYSWDFVSYIITQQLMISIAANCKIHYGLTLQLQGEDEVEETQAEILYRAMLPNLPQYMVCYITN